MLDEFIPSAETLLGLADAVPVNISLLDPNGKYLFVNQTFSDWIGVPRDQIVGQHGEKFLTIEDTSFPEGRERLIRELSGKGGTREFICHVRLFDGRVRTIDVRMVGHERHIGVYSFFRDITETEASIANEAKYRAVLDNAGEGVILMDPKGTISAFNKAAEKLFGYTAAEVVGTNIKRLMPSKYADHHDGYLQRYADTGVPRIIGKNDVEAEAMRKDGSIFPVALAVAETVVGGKTIFTGLVRDMTERKAYEDMRAQNEAKLEAEVQRRGRALDQIFNLSGDVLAILSYEGHFISVSPSAEKLTGVPVERAVNDKINYLAFAHPDDRENLRRVIEKAKQTGEPVLSYEFRIPHTTDGSIRWSAWSAHPVPQDNVILVVGRDVTEDKMREDRLRQTQKMEAIGQLTGGIAHDFNNLLAVISGSMDMMTKRIEQGRVDQIGRYVSATQQATTRAADLTKRLLAFARRQPLAPVPVNANDLVTSMEQLFSRSIGPSIVLDLDLETEVWNTVCDPNQLESSILNCVMNARDAMPDGGTLSICTANVTEEKSRTLNVAKGEWVMIVVEDSGAGMTDSVLARAFDPFFTTKPIGQGTGLGLSMLYGFVSQSGGHVKIESEVDKGTIVRIFLPRFSGELGVVPVVEDELMPRIALEGQTILVVEDEPLVRELLVEVMQSCGFQTVEAHDSVSAIPILESQQRIDLLLSDVGLPGMNGRQLAEVARTHRPELKVLFITGYAPTATVRDQFLAEGMDMMTKPFEVDEVAKRVGDMLAANAVAA